MQDTDAIAALCEKLDGNSNAARALGVTPQQLHNWRKRKRVSPHRRLHFLTVFNEVMPKAARLDLTWLASPAANYHNGSKGNGRKSRRTKGKAAKGPARKARSQRGKRSKPRPRS